MPKNSNCFTQNHLISTYILINFKVIESAGNYDFEHTIELLKGDGTPDCIEVTNKLYERQVTDDLTNHLFGIILSIDFVESSIISYLRLSFVNLSFLYTRHFILKCNGYTV